MKAEIDFEKTFRCVEVFAPILLQAPFCLVLFLMHELLFQ